MTVNNVPMSRVQGRSLRAPAGALQKVPIVQPREGFMEGMQAVAWPATGILRQQRLLLDRAEPC